MLLPDGVSGVMGVGLLPPVLLVSGLELGCPTFAGWLGLGSAVALAFSRAAASACRFYSATFELDK